MRIQKIAALLASACLLLPAGGCSESTRPKEVQVFTTAFAASGTAIPEDNEIQQLIGEKIGAYCLETWLGDRDTAEKAFSDMIMNSEYPDIVVPDSETCQKMIQVGALIPIDSYWDDYPNLKNYFTDEEWDRVRAEDGHIYYIPPFSNVYMKDTATLHNDEAFWIQLRVLKWAGYPEIKTLDQYFDLIESYLEANPTDENGNAFIGHEICANDAIFFGLDNAPMFLDGYPNDGCCIVDPETLEAKDYNLSPTAKRWFSKLNEEYKKGVVDPEFSFLSLEEYMDKLSTGLVLGTVDQYWNYNNAVKNLPPECTYIPLGLTIDEGIEERYHSRTAFDPSSGVGVTISCKDPEGALQFLNDILSPEILRLRFWGIEGVDYEVGDDGVFYQTEEQAERFRDKDYANQHICLYSYLPFYWGMDHDGINAYNPSNQPEEFYKSCSPEVRECFDAYGARTYVELLNPAPENAPWYPMWSYQNALPQTSDVYKASQAIESAKHQYLPQLVMADDFEAAWADYNEAYDKLDSEVFFDALTEEVRRLSQ